MSNVVKMNDERICDRPLKVFEELGEINERLERLFIASERVLKDAKEFEKEKG